MLKDQCIVLAQVDADVAIAEGQGGCLHDLVEQVREVERSRHGCANLIEQLQLLGLALGRFRQGPKTAFAFAQALFGALPFLQLLPGPHQGAIHAPQPKPQQDRRGEQIDGLNDPNFQICIRGWRVGEQS